MSCCDSSHAVWAPVRKFPHNLGHILVDVEPVGQRDLLRLVLVHTEQVKKTRPADWTIWVGFGVDPRHDALVTEHVPAAFHYGPRIVVLVRRLQYGQLGRADGALDFADDITSEVARLVKVSQDIADEITLDGSLSILGRHCKEFCKESLVVCDVVDYAIVVVYCSSTSSTKTCKRRIYTDG